MKIKFTTIKEILKSTLLEYEKSTFLLDILKHHSGQGYINIQQTIVGDDNKQELKIKFSILSDIIFVLENYKKEIAKNNVEATQLYFSEDKQQSVVDRYLKGIPIQGLALQLDCTSQIIEQLLFYKGIEIVDQSVPASIKKAPKRR